MSTTTATGNSSHAAEQQLTVIPWSTIRAEYRRLKVPSLTQKGRSEQAALRRAVVDLFWRYQGRVTDGEKSDMVVTSASFARQMGLPQTTLRGWLKGIGTCINTGVPPREGFVRPMNRTLKQAIRAVAVIDEGTRQLIAEDLAETQVLLDKLQSCLNHGGTDEA
jgi:uncharacterized protein YnzC (UPF0291/DUF896 family)